MIIHLASNNDHKLHEMRSALPGVELRTPRDAGLDFDFPEDEDSFLGNALGKATALWRLLGGAVLADDSGLCVDALGGRPGVLSARYGSPPGGQPLASPERNRLLLSEMEGVKDRSCRFVCCLALVLSPWRTITVQETCEGELLLAPRGSDGFGYDPIVFLPSLGRSVAELGMEEKNRVSHRGRAVRRLVSLLSSLDAAP